jgi:hypothetical protein
MADAISEKPARERSPSFPFISLKAAVERLTEYEAKFGRTDPTADRVYLAWGMSGDTSQSQQTLAALKAFGLVDYRGAGAKRFVTISHEGRTYLRAQQEQVRKDVLKRVALKPKWIGHFFGIWGTDKVPDELRLDTLVLEHRFNQNAGPKFLKVYDETISFAELSSFDKMIGVEGAVTDTEEIEEIEVPASPKAPEPKGGGSNKGLHLMQGEREITKGLLSKGASFRLIVSGHIGAKEIELLIKKLEIDKEILAEIEPEGGIE